MARGTKKVPELNVEYCNSSTIFHILKTFSYKELQEFDKEFTIFFKNARDKEAKDIGFELKNGDNVLVKERGMVRKGVVIKVKRTRAIVRIQSVDWDVPLVFIEKEN